MIDTARTTTCKHCGKPIEHIPGHRRREYCSDTCKQLAYRERKEQPQPVVTIVDDRHSPLEEQNIKRIEHLRPIECHDRHPVGTLFQENRHCRHRLRPSCVLARMAKGE